MSWVKEANRIGKYERSLYGFRIYCTKEPTFIESYFMKDGEKWRITHLISGWYIAIDKTGHRIECDNIGNLCFKIEIERLRRYYEKRDGVELEWK